MSLSQPQHFDEFKKLVEGWMAAYRYVSLSALAIKTKKGAVLLFGRIIFEFAKPEGGQDFYLETGGIVARRMDVQVSKDTIDILLAEFLLGKISLGEQQFHLEREGEYLSSSYYPLYHPLINSGPRLPTVVVRGAGRETLLHSENYRQVEHIDWDLKSSDQPFDTLDELLAFIGLPNLLQMPDMTTLELVARAPLVLIDSSKVENSEAIINCRLAKGLDPTLVKVGYKVASNGFPHRSHVVGKELSWEDEDFFFKWHC